MNKRATRAEQERQAAYARLLDAALDLYSEKGVAGGTTAEVAARAGVSKGLVFNYFPTKDHLLQALIERTMGDILGYWEQHDWSGAPAEQLRRVAEVALAHVAERPGFFRFYFSLMLQPDSPPAATRAAATLRPRLEFYFGQLRDVMTALGSDDPLADARLFQLALVGLSQMIATTPALLGPEADALLAGLRDRLLATYIRSP
jgi:AcrR family transcriptional regulator